MERSTCTVCQQYVWIVRVQNKMWFTLNFTFKLFPLSGYRDFLRNNGCGMKLTTHLHIMLRLRMGRAITHSSMFLHGLHMDNLTLPFSIQNISWTETSHKSTILQNVTFIMLCITTAECVQWLWLHWVTLQSETVSSRAFVALLWKDQEPALQNWLKGGCYTYSLGIIIVYSQRRGLQNDL